MPKPIDHPESHASGLSPRLLKTAGLLFIAAGLILGLDQIIRTGWLGLIVLPVIGLIGVVAGLRLKSYIITACGALIAGPGIGAFFYLTQAINLETSLRIGLFLLLLAFGWIWVCVSTIILRIPPAMWAIVPGFVIGGASIPFLTNQLTILNFVFYVGTGLGLALLGWGLVNKLFGLIIPGALLLGIGPGIYFAWVNVIEANGLSETGIMLVWFALGWGLITIFSRVVTERFVWWPLIPGGILAMVGWGLYIGGDPDNALTFISNTGSIGLLLLGIYLLILRRSFKE